MRTDEFGKPYRPDPYDSWDTLRHFVSEGAKAKDVKECPYGENQLYQRCAWFAGYNDKARGL